MTKIVSLAIGGVLGTWARYFLTVSITQFVGIHFPYGTIVVNLSGCFLMGFLVVFLEGPMNMQPNLMLLLVVGFCGAFTTFSTFILETSGMIRDGNTLHALANVVISVIAGFILFRIGMWLGDTIF
jgi:CrcB protein